MDPYSAESFMLERHRAMASAAERRARLTPGGPVPVRLWAAARLRLLADRLDGAAIARSQRPTA
ncbi:MAG: hypothetical protein E6J20_15060 [Chloroflexi bacterium]|nr:MAG: hypothetical protein E6J20_15060 [Chloroflexota bacterium]